MSALKLKNVIYGFSVFLTLESRHQNKLTERKRSNLLVFSFLGLEFLNICVTIILTSCCQEGGLGEIWLVNRFLKEKGFNTMQ